MSTPLLNTKPEELPPLPPKQGVLAATFRAFQYRDFRLMWGGAFTSTTGAFVQEVAQSWLVYTLTDSAFLLGLTAFLNGAPILLFSLLGGVAADRVDRRKLLLGSQYVQMASALVLAGLLATDMIEIWHIMAAAFATGMGQAFGGPAYQALIPSLVEKEDLPNAIALMSIQFNLARVVGPVVGGLAFTGIGPAACFFINALTFLAVIFSLFVIHVRFVPKKSEAHVLHSLKEGLRFTFRQHSLLALVALSTVTAFFAVPLITLLPVFARETYQLGAQGYGTMLSFSGAGAVTGALFVAWLGNTGRKGWTALVMQVALGLVTIGFAMSTHLWAGCFFVFLAGGAVLAVFALLNSLVQLLCPEEMRGRIMSVYHTAFRGAMPLGNLAAGSLASRFGAPLVVSVNAVILILVAGWYLVKDKEVGRL
jgi:predicted MFS family arabinose efflux permease